MKHAALFFIFSLGFLLSCDGTNPTSSSVEISVSGTVVPADAQVIFILGQDTTDIDTDSEGYFNVSIDPGRGTFVITADGYRTYRTSPTYNLEGTYDLGEIQLSDVPSLISSITKTTTYSQNNYLFYISFSEEMDPASKSALSLDPPIDGTLSWSHNNTRLYFYPNPQYIDTAAFTVTLGTDAASAEGEALEFSYAETFSPSEARITRVYPNSGTMDFSTTREAYLEFSVPVSDSNLAASIESDPEVPLELRIENQTVYIRPLSGSWQPSREYVLSLEDTLYTLSGAPLVFENFNWTFTTASGSGGDEPHPLGSIVKNTNYSQNSYLFYLNFDLEMDPDSEGAVSTEPAIDGNYTWGNNNTRLYFYPNPAFLDTTDLTVQIDTTAVSADGESLAFNYEETFTAGEARIVRSYPNANTFDFGTNREAYLEFSAAMSDSNLSEAIEVDPNIALDLRVQGQSIYILPSSGNWPEGTTVTLSLEDTLYSVTGTPIYTENYSWWFTTRSGSGGDGVTPYPVSSIIKTSSYSANSYLFYVNFSVEMDTASKYAVSTSPSINGTYTWANNNTQLYFYPVPTFMDTVALTVRVDTTAFSTEGDTVGIVYEKTFQPNETRITRHYPNHNTVDFSTSREAYLEFSTVISESGVAEAIVSEPDVPLDIRVTGQNIYILPESGTWPSGTSITLSLTDTLYSVTGVPIFVEGYSWSFTTSGGTSGGSNNVVQLTPDSGATEFGLNGNLYVRTTNTDLISVNQMREGFSVTDASGIPVSGTYNMQSSYFYFYPKGLKLGEWYWARVIVIDSTSNEADTLVNSAFRTVPFSPTSVYPSNYGTLNLSTDPFEIVMNNDVDKLTVISSLAVDSDEKLNYTVSQKTITILPVSGAWRAGEEFVLTIDSQGLLDLVGNSAEQMDSAYHFSAPEIRVIDHSPLNNAEDVDSSTTVVLTFNTIMDTAATNAAFSIQDSTGADHEGGSLTWDGNRVELTYTPVDSIPFLSGMRYTVGIDSTAMDTYDEEIESPFSLLFTVQ